MAKPINELSLLGRNLQQLSTQIDFENLDIDNGSQIVYKGLELQNNCAEIKKRATRRTGERLLLIESRIELKNLLDRLRIPFKVAQRWQKEALVPEEDFEAYLTNRKENEKEITDVGLARIGKGKKSSRIQTVAEKILEKLTPWLKNHLLEDINQKDFAGTIEHINQVKCLLFELSEKFRVCAENL